jgi:hypothetical protein
VTLYRAVSGGLCASFALVGAVFLLLPDRLLALFDGWSASLGLATSAGPADPFFLVLAVAYMVLVTALAWAMFRDPGDAAPARLLLLAKLASALLSFSVFFLRQPHLILLVNGVVDGSIGILVLLLLKSRGRSGAERPA